jgi:hypothetical protein
MEEWRAIIGHDGYEVSNLGNVRGSRGVLKGFLNQYGYARVELPNRNQYLVSRLVATAFIPNPEGKPEVDHIDRNSANNVVSNLRWATSSEQKLNTETKRGVSGERNIYPRPNGSYKVAVKRGTKERHIGVFTTIAEAVAARDEFLNRPAILPAVEDGHPHVMCD